MARPVKEIDERQFERLCRLQCTEAEICSVLGVTDKTLTRWCKRNYGAGFSEVFVKKRELGKTSLRKAQFDLAKKSPAMAIWLGKQYLGQRDEVDHTIKGPINDDALSASLRALAENLEGDD